MIYIFKAGALAEQISAIAKEADLMIYRRAFIDYDFERHCKEILSRLRAIRSSLKNAPLSPFLNAQWDRCEERLETLKEHEAAVGIELLVQLQKGLLTQLKQQTFLMLDNAHASLFDQRDPFGDAVSALFPDTTTDIHEGVQCLALERYTASVFHMMRAAEHALRYLAREVGVANVEEKDFGQLVQETRDQRNAVKSRDPEKKWTADALASLDLFKDARRRNPVCHARNDHYTEERARDVYNGTRAFMQSLTRRAAR